jgi:hypothetical protein
VQRSRRRDENDLRAPAPAVLRTPNGLDAEFLGHLIGPITADVEGDYCLRSQSPQILDVAPPDGTAPEHQEAHARGFGWITHGVD